MLRAKSEIQSYQVTRENLKKWIISATTELFFDKFLTFIEDSIESSRKFEICQKIVIVHMIRISIFFY